MPDRPFQRIPGDLQRPGGVTGPESTESRPDITPTKVPQWPGAYNFEHGLQQAFVEGARSLRRAIEPFATYCLGGTFEAFAYGAGCCLTCRLTVPAAARRGLMEPPAVSRAPAAPGAAR